MPSWLTAEINLARCRRFPDPGRLVTIEGGLGGFGCLAAASPPGGPGGGKVGI